jgi:hypothetical protein
MTSDEDGSMSTDEDVVVVESAESRGRPLGVVVLSIVVLIIGIQSILGGLDVLPMRFGSMAALLGDARLANAWSIGVGVTAVAAAVATFMLWRVGWVMVLLLAGSGMALQIILYFAGEPNYPTLALWVVATFYLNQREVKSRFVASRHDATTVLLTTEQDDEP